MAVSLIPFVLWSGSAPLLGVNPLPDLLILLGLYFLMFGGWIPIAIFGGGGLLYFGARYLAGLPGAGYWKSVGVNILSVLAGLAAGMAIDGLITSMGARPGLLLGLVLVAVAGLPATWAVIMMLFRTTFAKAVLAWLPTLALLISAVGLGVALLLPSLGHKTQAPVQATANQAPIRKDRPEDLQTCRENLRAIGEAITAYKANNHGAWPPNLPTIERYGRKLSFVCPSASHTPGIDDPDYFYLPPGTEASGYTIIVCDYGSNHTDEYRSILYADMEVNEVYGDFMFQKMMDQPANRVFARALRAAEGQRTRPTASATAPAGLPSP